jgi:hypothetical protein
VSTVSFAYRRSRDVLSRSFAGEVLLAAAGVDDFESLSATAGSVWRLLDEPRSIDEIVGTLAERYPDAGPAIGPDVESLIEYLAQRGLVERLRVGDG